jgi:hypothetical protein
MICRNRDSLDSFIRFDSSGLPQPGVVRRRENDRRRRDSRQFESRDQIAGIIYGFFPIVDAAPFGEKRQDSATGDALAAIGFDAGVAVAFGEAAAVLAYDQRDMDEMGQKTLSPALPRITGGGGNGEEEIKLCNFRRCSAFHFSIGNVPRAGGRESLTAT